MTPTFTSEQITDMAVFLAERHPLYTMIPNIPAYEPLQNQAFDICLEIIKGTRSSEKLTIERKESLYTELPNFAKRFVAYALRYERYKNGLESKYAMWQDAARRDISLPDKKAYELVLKELSLDILLGSKKTPIEELIKKEITLKKQIAEREKILSCINLLSKEQ